MVLRYGNRVLCFPLKINKLQKNVNFKINTFGYLKNLLYICNMNLTITHIGMGTIECQRQSIMGGMYNS